MPELPEVESFRRQIEEAIRGKTVKDVEVRPDSIVFCGESPAKVKKVFLGQKVKECKRKGKYLWLELDQKPWPVFHLGMKGFYVIAKEKPLPSAKSVKLVLEMNDGTFFVFKDPRRFGRVFLMDDPLAEKPIGYLGADVHTELPSVQELKELIGHKKAPIKSALLNQETLAGIGNWMADEILFQSGIDPHRRCCDLTPIEIKRIHSKIRSVTTLSVDAGADDSRYPASWIFHHRWGKKAGKISTGEKIKHSVVGGRTTAWVPAKQK